MEARMTVYYEMKPRHVGASERGLCGERDHINNKASDVRARAIVSSERSASVYKKLKV